MKLPGQAIFSPSSPRNRILVLALLTVITLGANLTGALAGISAVLSQFLYFPVILASYWYPRRGPLFSAGIAVIYGCMVFLYAPPDPSLGLVTLTRMVILVLVGCIVSLLSWNLSRSEQQLHDIIEFLPDATFAIDQEGRIIAWNRAIEAMTGGKKPRCWTGAIRNTRSRFTADAGLCLPDSLSGTGKGSGKNTRT